MLIDFLTTSVYSQSEEMFKVYELQGEEIEDGNEEQISLFLSLIYEALFSSQIKGHYAPKMQGASNSANLNTNDTDVYRKREDIVYIESKKH